MHSAQNELLHHFCVPIRRKYGYSSGLYFRLCILINAVDPYIVLPVGLMNTYKRVNVGINVLGIVKIAVVEIELAVKELDNVATVRRHFG